MCAGIYKNILITWGIKQPFFHLTVFSKVNKKVRKVGNVSKQVSKQVGKVRKSRKSKKNLKRLENEKKRRFLIQKP